MLPDVQTFLIKHNWSCEGNLDIRHNKINITFFTGWHGRSSPLGKHCRPRRTMFPLGDNLPCHPVMYYLYIVTPRKHCRPRRSRGRQCCPRGDNLPCHPVKNVIFILLYWMSHFYNKFHRCEILPCDIQNCDLANWPIRLLEIRYNNCRWSMFQC